MLNRSMVESYLKIMNPDPTSLIANYEPKDKVQCILFDIYGTLFISASGDIGLLQSNPASRNLLQELLDEYNLAITTNTLLDSLAHEIEAVHLSQKSRGVDHPEVNIISIWNSVINKSGIISEELIREFAIRFELIVNPVYPMPGLKESLDWCRSSQKVLGIISNAQFYTPLLFDWFLESNLHELGFLEELTLLSFEFGYAKPSQFLFKRAVEIIGKLGIPYHQVVYLGNDMLNDILPAKQAGFQTALFAGDTRSLRLRVDDPRCQDIKPDMVITELTQITSWQ